MQSRQRYAVPLAIGLGLFGLGLLWQMRDDQRDSRERTATPVASTQGAMSSATMQDAPSVQVETEDDAAPSIIDAGAAAIRAPDAGLTHGLSRADRRKPDAGQDSEWSTLLPVLGKWMSNAQSMKAVSLLRDHCINLAAIAEDLARAQVSILKDGGMIDGALSREGMRASLELMEDVIGDLSGLSGGKFDRSSYLELRETEEWRALCPDYREYLPPGFDR